MNRARWLGAIPIGAALTIAAALTIGIAVAAHHTHPRAERSPETVLVEEDVSDLPVGATIHVCLEQQPCRTNQVRADGRSNPPQLVTIPLPSGVSSRQANGWTVRAYAFANGVEYRGTTQLIYHVAVDPLCTCAGDYAYLDVARTRG